MGLFCTFVILYTNIPMLLSKELAVELNIIGYKLKHFIAVMLNRYDVPLTPEQFLLIDLLWNEGPKTQQELADQMQKDKNSVTNFIDALESKGLVMRKQSSSDRRSNIIAPTDKAQELKSEIKLKGISILDTMLAGIDEDELRSFINTMRKLDKNMSAI